MKKIPNLVIFSSVYLFILSEIAAFTTLTNLSALTRLSMAIAAFNTALNGSHAFAVMLLGIICLFELFFIAMFILVPIFTCVISTITGIGLLKREKWSRDVSSLVFILGLIYYMAVALQPSDPANSAQKSTSHFIMFGFLNVICLSLGLYSMRFDRKVNHYFNKTDS